MAGLRYGIKEVADVRFYPVGGVDVGADGSITATKTAVLELDTLKVSNIEFTGEQSEARPLHAIHHGRDLAGASS